MKVTILCVGKIKEKFFSDAIDEYIKRLGRYCKPEIIQVPDEKDPGECSDKVVTAVKDKEGEKLLKHLLPDALKIALCIDGKKMSSEKFAAHINETGLKGVSHIQFVIGGSLGLSDNVINACDEKLSFSDMTFPHQLMRVILLEQIYRAYRIISGEPYHK